MGSICGVTLRNLMASMDTFLLVFIKYSVYLPDTIGKNFIMHFVQTTLLANGGTIPWGVIGLIAVLLVILYFFILAPQQNQKKEEEKFAKGMKIGDKVVTIGGIHGAIVDMDEHKVLIQMMYNDAQILLEKQAISLEATKNRYKLPAPSAKKKKSAKEKSKSAAPVSTKTKK